MKVRVAAFLCGVLFAIGLGVSGMTNPNKVLGFLDVAGAWDPSLLYVMLGAVAVTFVFFRLARSRPAPLLAPSWQIPTRRELDGKLLVGALLFGVGWGLAGFCPGPAIVSLAFGHGPVLVFVVAMLAGILAQRLLSANGNRKQLRPRSGR